MTTSLLLKYPPRLIDSGTLTGTVPSLLNAHNAWALGHRWKCSINLSREYTRSRSEKVLSSILEVLRLSSRAIWQPLQHIPWSASPPALSKNGRAVVAIYRRSDTSLFERRSWAFVSLAWRHSIALITLPSAKTCIRLFRGISSIEYIPGVVLNTGTEFRRRAGFKFKCFFTSARDTRRSWGAVFMHGKQHLVNVGRKIKPPKEPQRRQSRAHSTLNKSRKVNHDAMWVRRLAQRVSRA